MTIRGRILWLEGVIPLAMESVADEMKRFEFVIGDFDAGGRGMAILHRSHREPFFGGGMRNQFNDRFQRGQRLGAPVEGDIRKELVFDFVPLAGAWGKMADGDAEPGLV